MITTPTSAAALHDEEHYVVSSVAFCAMKDIVDALKGLDQLTSGGVPDRQPEVMRNDLAAVFRVIGRELNNQLDSLPHVWKDQVR